MVRLAPEPNSPLAEALLDEQLIVIDLLFADGGGILWMQQMRGEMEATARLEFRLESSMALPRCEG